MITECEKWERQRTMAACPFLSSPGQVRLEFLQQRREENGAKTKCWGKYRTLGATQDISKPQPVHSTAHSVVVWQLLNGTWWREARWTSQEKKNH